MRRYFISISLALAALPAAADVALIGVIGDKAAVVAVDGGEPKTVKVGQKWQGITGIAVEKERATGEIEGKQRVLKRGRHYPTSERTGRSGRQTVRPRP